MQKMRISFDASEAERQADELSVLLAEHFPRGVPDDIIEDISRLLSDVSLSDGRSTLGAGGVREWRIFLRFGNCFDALMAAIRAGKISDFIHDHKL
jgi:hypothetical protein